MDLITPARDYRKQIRVSVWSRRYKSCITRRQGVWPALWTLGTNIKEVGWPRCGEMDIMELIGHMTSTTHATVQYANTTGQHIFNSKSTRISSGKFSDEYHVFSMIWEKDSVIFIVDDRVIQSATPSSLGSTNPYPFNAPFFFIFNVAVGGNWPGSPDETTSFPQSMIVDYIRVFQEK